MASHRNNCTFPLYFGVNAYILVFSFSHYLILEVLIGNSILQLHYYTIYYLSMTTSTGLEMHLWTGVNKIVASD